MRELSCHLEAVPVHNHVDERQVAPEVVVSEGRHVGLQQGVGQQEEGEHPHWAHTWWRWWSSRQGNCNTTLYCKIVL